MTESYTQFKNGLIYCLRLAVGALFPLIMLPIFTRILTKADYGVLALVQVYAVLVTGLCNLGLRTAFDRNYFEIKNPEFRRGLLLSSMLFVAFMMLVSGFLTFVFSRILAGWFAQSAEWSHLLCYAFCGTAMVSLNQYFYTYVRNEEDAALYLKFSILEKSLVMLVSVIFVVWKKIGIEGLPLGQCVGSGVAFVIMSINVFSGQKIAMSWAQIRASLKLGCPLTPRVLIGTLSNQFDKYMIGLMKASGSVGIYSVGQMFANVVFIFETTIQNVFQPQVYKRMFSKNKDAAAIDIGVYLTPFAYLTVAVGLMLVLFSEEVLSVYLPASYSGCIEICIVLTLYYVLLFFGKQPQIMYKKRVYVILFLSVFRVLLNVGLNIYFILRWGALGAAVATLLAGIISTAIAFTVAQASYRIAWQYARIGAMYMLLFVAAIGVLAMRRWGCVYIYRFAFKVVVLLLFTGLGMYCGILSKQSLAMLKGAFSRNS